MHTSAPAIVNVINCGPDSVVDQYTLLKPTVSLHSTLTVRVTS